MPHQCVRCNKFYDDGSDAILRGCSCGAKLFFYVRKDALEKVKEMTAELTRDEKKEIEEDVYEIIGEEEKEKPVILDIESIRVLEPGKFEIDLVHLFKKDPLIYRVGDGKYIIDLVSLFGEKIDKRETKKTKEKKSAKKKK